MGISVSSNGTILTKTVRPDGSVVRWSFVPGSDVSTAPQAVQDAAASAWTQAVLDAFRTVQWLVSSATGALITDQITTIPAGHQVAAYLGVATPRTHKWNGSAVVAKTQAEIDAYDATALSTKSLATSRQKDILAMCALVVRARGIAAWNAMTTSQKVTATLAEADVWKGIREFIDDKI